MITITEALSILDKHIQPLPVSRIPLLDAGQLILAEELLAPMSMPPFRQSSMDGYAVCSHPEVEYEVVAEVKAGASSDISLLPGQAVRIFTGARVPDDANTVVIQEHVKQRGDKIIVEQMPARNTNIRPLGEQVTQGASVLQPRTRLNAAAIGFLGGMGFTTVPVFPRPKVSVLITGDELKSPGESLKEGEIYESNSLMLAEALKTAGVREIRVSRVRDALADTVSAIREALDWCDLMMISGGISVGDYDFVEEALQANEVEPLFYQVRQKPGKPLWFGQKDQRYVFALPGNPASGLTSFFLYVRPMLLGMMGHEAVHLPRQQAILTQPIRNKTSRALFMKARISHGMATPLTGQASSMLNTYAISNGLIMVSENIQDMSVGDKIYYVALPD